MNRDDEQLLRYLGRQYQKCQFLEYLDEGNVREKEEVQAKQEFMFLIESILKSMSSDLSLIIRNDYLKKREEKWWQAYFTKSTYYRKKNQAVHEFVSCVKR